MLSSFEEILSAALALPAEARAMLADRLLESLDGPDQKRIDALWAEEAERRMREIEEGKVEAIDGELVMQKLRSRLRMKRAIVSIVFLFLTCGIAVAVTRLLVHREPSQSVLAKPISDPIAKR